MKALSELKLHKKKYIIFDMDGTLIDSIGVWNSVDKLLIERYGQIKVSLEDIQEERDTFLHNNQSSDIYIAYCQYLISKYNLSLKDADELLRIRFAISGEVLEKEMDFKPYAVDLILKLKRLGFTLVLATMTTQVQIDIYSKKNQNMLKQMNILDVFDLITRKEDVKTKKPSPEIYFAIMQHYNAHPDECLIFEDSYTGVLASYNAGVEVVNVYDKYSSSQREQILEIADYSINDFSEFISLVDTLYPNEKNR